MKSARAGFGFGGKEVTPSSRVLSSVVPTRRSDVAVANCPQKAPFSPQEKPTPKANLNAKQGGSFPPHPQLQPQNCGLLVSLERFFGEKMCSETFACLPLPALVFLTLEKKKSDLHESLTSLLWENPAFCCCCCFALGWIPWTWRGPGK